MTHLSQFSVSEVLKYATHVTIRAIRPEDRKLVVMAALARGHGLAHFEADVLSRKSPMLAVLKRCGFPMHQRQDGDVVHLTLDLAASDGAVS